MTNIKKLEYNGKYYKATVPDTLDLSERARLAINALGGTIDPDMHYQMFFYINYCSRNPYMKHHSADVTCNPKFAESFPLMRIMCGSEQYKDVEEAQRAELISMIQDGLYWNLKDSSRPWRLSYNPKFDGEFKDEDVSNPGAVGRMIRALLTWKELSDDLIWDKYLFELVVGLTRIAISTDNYSYYPDGGFGEPYNYPRSGWIKTDEAKGEVEGGEGTVVGYHGHQIQGMMRWYAMSGDKRALDLSARLTRYCMLPKFWGGIPDPDETRERIKRWMANPLPDPVCIAGKEQGHWFSHFHARAIALRGILEFGMVAGDWRAIEFVRMAYEYTLTLGIPKTGWINCFPAAVDLMEGCALGDIIALGIRLSDAGIGDYWDDVDAIVRNQLAETQLIDGDILKNISSFFDVPKKEVISSTSPVPYPKQLVHERVIERSIGIFGSYSSPTAIPEPQVLQCCTGNATQGLYYAWEGIVREKGETAQINLLLNRAAKLLDIDSYLPYEGKVVIHNKLAKRIYLRIPFWVVKKDVVIKINETLSSIEWVDNYIAFSGLKPQDEIEVLFPVNETTSSYTANSGTRKEQTYSCVFRGSTLIDISPRDTSDTSYPLYNREYMKGSQAPLKDTTRYEPEIVITKW